MSSTSISATRPCGGGAYRPQLELLEHRLAPGSISAAQGPSPDLDLLLVAAITASQQQGNVTTTSPVVDFATRSIVFGESTLIRTDNGVTANLSATGLAPGVYTFWMRVDMPGGGTVAGRLAGHVVGQSGNLNFAAHVSTGEVLSGHPILPSGALQDPLHATITLVVRTHGPAEPGRIHEQTHNFEPTMASNFLVSIHAPPP